MLLRGSSTVLVLGSCSVAATQGIFFIEGPRRWRLYDGKLFRHLLPVTQPISSGTPTTTGGFCGEKTQSFDALKTPEQTLEGQQNHPMSVWNTRYAKTPLFRVQLPCWQAACLLLMTPTSSRKQCKKTGRVPGQSWFKSQLYSLIYHDVSWYEGFPSHGGSPIAGWFISGKIPI